MKLSRVLDHYRIQIKQEARVELEQVADTCGLSIPSLLQKPTKPSEKGLWNKPAYES